MSNGEFDKYPAFEVKTRDDIDRGSIDPKVLESAAMRVCWSVSALNICVEDWSNDTITIGFYLAGIRIATARLRANDPCVRSSGDGGVAKYSVEVCANFANRNITAKGEVCVAFVCARFNQVIFTW
jgi:hypothetical protein